MGAGVRQGGVPVERLGDFTLGPEIVRVLDRALDLTTGAGGGRVTTSFLLVAMIKEGQAPDAPPLLRLLYAHATEPDAHAFRGVWAAYIAWFRSTADAQALVLGQDPWGLSRLRVLWSHWHAYRYAVFRWLLLRHRHAMPDWKVAVYRPVTEQTDYLYDVLDRAAALAVKSGSRELRLSHLLASLLTYSPGTGRITPGAQYLLTLFGPGMPGLKSRLARSLEEHEPVAGEPGWWGRALGL